MGFDHWTPTSFRYLNDVEDDRSSLSTHDGNAVQCLKVAQSFKSKVTNVRGVAAVMMKWNLNPQHFIASLSSILTVFGWFQSLGDAPVNAIYPACALCLPVWEFVLMMRACLP
jgi:hypothetical protein